MRRRIAIGAALSGFASTAWSWSSNKGPSSLLPGCKLAAQVFIEKFCASGPAQDGDNGQVWHTESLGVSMLAAVATRNEGLFAKLDQHARKVRRADGLHSWKVSPQGVIVDKNNATDGDIFIAWAYLLAGQNFHNGKQGYDTAADQTLAAIVKHCVRSSSHGVVLLPGMEGFTHDSGEVRTINLSYWVYPALHAFAQHDAKGPWNTLIDNGRKISAYAHFGDYGLPPDWLELSNPVKPDAKLSTRFSYDAMRVPLYLHLAGYRDHPCVERSLRFFSTAQRSWIDLTSGQMSPYGVDPSAEVVIRQLRSTKGQTPSLRQLAPRYYPASLAVLAGMTVCA